MDEGSPFRGEDEDGIYDAIIFSFAHHPLYHDPMTMQGRKAKLKQSKPTGAYSIRLRLRLLAVVSGASKCQKEHGYVIYNRFCLWMCLLIDSSFYRRQIYVVAGFVLGTGPN